MLAFRFLSQACHNRATQLLKGAAMNTIEEVLAFNKTFVEEKRDEQFETDK